MIVFLVALDDIKYIHRKKRKENYSPLLLLKFFTSKVMQFNDNKDLNI
jgi:hypothetical protein